MEHRISQEMLILKVDSTSYFGNISKYYKNLNNFFDKLEKFLKQK